MRIATLALRNVTRNRHRTLVTFLATALAGTVMVFYVSLMNGMFEMLERNIVSMELGEIELHPQGYLDDPDIYKRISGYRTLMEKLEKKGLFASGRLYAFALAAASGSSSSVMLRGIDPAKEAKVTDLEASIARGAWLRAGDTRGVVLGRKLADALGAGPGEEVVVVAQAADGSISDEIFRVRGILKSLGRAVDSSGLFMTESAWRHLMAIEKGVHEIALRRVSREMSLEEALSIARAAAPGLDVRSWRQLRPMAARLFDVSTYSMYFMYVVTYAAVAAVVLNSTLMGVFERIHELGVMKALGAGPLSILTLVLTEALTITIAAGVAALGAGIALSLHFEKSGIDLTSFVGGASFYGVALDPVWYTRPTLKSAVQPVIFLLIMTGAGAIYPALRAAIITPLEAICYR